MEVLVQLVFVIAFSTVAYYVYKAATTKKDTSERDARNAGYPKAPDDKDGDPAAGPDGKH